MDELGFMRSGYGSYVGLANWPLLATYWPKSVYISKCCVVEYSYARRVGHREQQNSARDPHLIHRRQEEMLTKEEKGPLVKDFETHEGDTGSPEVQVAILTRRIQQLTAHLRAHRHDFASQRGLLKLVSKRRRQLFYLSKEDPDRYKRLISRLGLRR